MTTHSARFGCGLTGYNAGDGLQHCAEHRGPADVSVMAGPWVRNPLDVTDKVIKLFTGD